MISIIIPAYNEEKTVGTTLSRVLKLDLNQPKEVIVVDDGSVDRTWEIVSETAKNNKDMRVFKHTKNAGKGAAVRTGLKHAKGKIIVIQDADLEYNPKDIPKLIKPILNKEARVVYGTRLKMKPVFFGKNKTPLLLHFFGNKMLSLITSALYGQSISDMETGYKIFEKDVMKGVKLHSKSFDFEPEITAKIIKKGIKIVEFPISTNPRGYDEGKKIRPVKDGIKALSTLIKYRFTN